jgi:hypothetical protein
MMKSAYEWETEVRARPADPGARHEWQVAYFYESGGNRAHRVGPGTGGGTYASADTARARARKIASHQSPDTNGPGRVLVRNRRTGEVLYYAVNGEVQMDGEKNETATPEPVVKTPAAAQWERHARAAVRAIPVERKARAFDYLLGAVENRLNAADVLGADALHAILEATVIFANE